MPSKISLEIPNIMINTPTIKDLKGFGLMFSKEEWGKLCENKVFMNGIFDNSIEESTKLAAEILK